MRGERGVQGERDGFWIGLLFLVPLAYALGESALPKNVMRKESRKVALHRRGSSQCGVKEESKGSGTALAWAPLSHIIGVRFDSGAPHALSPLRGTSRSLLSKTATSLRCFSARARYRRMWKLKGGAAPPGQQSMWGERGVLGERDGFGLGCSFSFHWRALSARARHRRM